MAPTSTPTTISLTDPAMHHQHGLTVGAAIIGVRDRALRGALLLEPVIQINFDDRAKRYELGSVSCL